MRALLALPCLAFACATTPEPIAAHNPPGAPTRLEAVPRPAPIFDGKQFALGQLTPAECETAARQLRQLNPDQAWEGLKARWVVVRGALKDVKQDGQKAAAMVSETSLRATSHEVQVGTVSRRESSSSTTARAEAQTTRFGNARGSATVDSRDRSEFSTVKQKFENERIETGRQAVGKLPQADPFLEPEKDFIFIARFDGVKPGEDDKPIALLSIAGYYPPNALLIQ